MKTIVNMGGRSVLYHSATCPAAVMIAEVLADRMAELHLDKHALADRCKHTGRRVCATTIDTLLSGVSNPRLDTLEALAEALELNLTLTFPPPT